jgi:hypothetical protein
MTGKSETQMKLTSADDQINIKLQYLETEEKKVKIKSFALLWNHICSIHNKQISVVKSLRSINPTAGARIFLGREDVTTTFAGQVLAIKQCTSIIPEKIYWSREINTTCYKQIVLRENKVLLCYVFV